MSARIATKVAFTVPLRMGDSFSGRYARIRSCSVVQAEHDQGGLMRLV
jgi:hypothetical protein